MPNSDEQMTPGQRAWLIRNLEFLIAFSETNLRYLADEPDSEKKTESVARNQAAIAEAKQELATLKGESDVKHNK